MATAGPKPKKYQVLGSYDDFNSQLQTTLPPPKQPDPDTVDNVDHRELPQDVWFAATISPDRGEAIIRSFREIAKARTAYQHQLEHISTARREQELVASQPGTLRKPGATITHAVQQVSELRKLNRFEQQQQEWDVQSRLLARTTQRPTTDLAMQRGPSWRNREELTELLFRAQPPDFASSAPERWNMSLRNAWERIIPLGSIFSGLNAVIRERPGHGPESKTMQLGRPLDAHNPMSTGFTGATIYTGIGGKPPPGRALSARGRTWKDSVLLADRVGEFKPRIKALQPHNPDLNSLLLRGEALEGSLAALAHAPITLSEVEGHLEAHDTSAYAGYKAIKDDIEAQLLARLEQEEAARTQALEALRATAPKAGPHAELSTSFLSLECAPSSTGSSTFTMRNRGTAAVRFTWQRHAQQRPLHALAEHPPSAPCFYLTQPTGILLPGQTQTFAATFKAHRPGRFSERWVFVASPALLGPELSVCLSGTCAPEDTTGPARAVLSADLERKVQEREVGRVIDQLLAEVRPSPRIEPKPSQAGSEAAAKFDAANVEHVWPPLYPSVGGVAEMREVYAAANAALAQALIPPEEEDPKAKGKKDAGKAAAAKGKGKAGAEAASPDPPPLKYPEQWDGSVATLQAVVDELAALKPVSSRALVARLAKAIEAAKVPPGQHAVTEHAMRLLVLQLVDACEERLDATKAEYTVKLAEQDARKAAEAEAAAAAAAAAGEGGAAAVAAKRATSPARKGKGRKGVPAPEVIDQAWFASHAGNALKAVFKAGMPGLHEQMVKERLAIGDTLQARIAVLDEQLALHGEGDLDSDAHAALLLERFELLRQWTGLSIPPREGVQ